ncbi:site-2 protease family protein [Brevibacillus sp. H7]|jgi:Zn-dependent protease|uniref:site-2 protease family protein n=1 Tax=Brevibacillus sp. H7 TaxID=3349138 RepID=UPI003816B2D0
MNKTRSTFLAIGAFLLANLKWLGTFLKFSKFGTTFLSMIVSLGAYAWLYGWKFGAALVYLIFVHEMGHVIAAKRKGIRTSPAVFIPFAGAFISMKDQPRDARTEAYLAYGGPLAGMLAFLPALPLYWWTGHDFWALVIFLGAMINLFNLLPVSPLDGGRIVSVLSTKIWFFGLLGLLAMLVFSPDPLLFLIFLFGLMTWWNRLREGYQQRVLSYEKEKLLDFLDELAQWPTLAETAETRARLMTQSYFYAAAKPPKQRFFLPFFHDDRRFERDRIRLDKEYAERTWELFQLWERTPVLFLDGNPLRPVPSPLLAEAEQEARERLRKLGEQLDRLATYYDSPTKTKWKVLVAYLALAGALSLFLLYGSSLLNR